MRIVITGAGGFVGSNLARLLQSHGSVIPIYRTGGSEFRNWIDLSAPGSAEAMVRIHQPEVVIHCAGNKDVAWCAAHPSEAMAVNGLMTGRLARACRGVCRFVYLSSNHLWDGYRGGYCETDPPMPADAYGHSKLAGEQLSQMENPNSLIVRSGMIYGPGSPVLKWAETTLRTTGRLDAYVNAFSTPTYVDDLAKAIMQLVSMEKSGIWHFCGSQVMNRREFFSSAKVHFGWPGEIVPTPGRGSLPHDCSLDSQRAYETLGWMPHTVDAAMAEMAAA